MRLRGYYLIIAFVLAGQLCLAPSLGNSQPRVGSRQATVATPVQQQVPKPGASKKARVIQQPAVNNAKGIPTPTVVPTPQPVPVAKLTADRSEVQVGEEVKFAVAPVIQTQRARYTFTFDFGDGTQQKTDQPKTVHHYRAAGSRTASVSLQLNGVLTFVPKPFVLPAINILVVNAPLDAAPNPVEVGVPVTFTTKFSAKDSNVRYRFSFGDSPQPEPWLDQPQARHAYAATGKHHAYAEIGIAGRGSVVTIDRSAEKTVEVKPVPPGTVTFSAIPAAVNPDEPVSFKVKFASRNPDIRYRFVFDDGSPPSAWDMKTVQIHSYAVAREYHPYAEIGLLHGGSTATIAATTTQLITVKAPPPTLSPSPTFTPSVSPGVSITPTPGHGGLQTFLENWWKYLIVALLFISFVGYRTLRKIFAPRATFRSIPDVGGADVNDGMQALAITSQVLLRPNLATAEYEVHTDEAEFVRSVRRENG
jgi:hypothetical protein